MPKPSRTSERPLKPPRPPPAATTRWQGTLGAKGLRRSAEPTALAEDDMDLDLILDEDEDESLPAEMSDDCDDDDGGDDDVDAMKAASVPYVVYRPRGICSVSDSTRFACAGIVGCARISASKDAVSVGRPGRDVGKLWGTTLLAAEGRELLLGCVAGIEGCA